MAFFKLRPKGADFGFILSKISLSIGKRVIPVLEIPDHVGGIFEGNRQQDFGIADRTLNQPGDLELRSGVGYTSLSGAHRLDTA